MTYTEVRELAYLGATVLHEDAIFPVKAAGIPIHICNTMEPAAPGTWIVARSQEPAGAITGLAGRRGYSAIQVEKAVQQRGGYCRKTLSCLEKTAFPLSIWPPASAASLVAQTAYVNAHRQRLLEDMEAAVHPDSLQILDRPVHDRRGGRAWPAAPGRLPAF